MEQRYEQIELYLAGALTEDELVAFEQAMKGDPALAQEVALHQMAQDFLVQSDEIDLRKNLEVIGAEIDLDKNSETNNPKRNSRLNLNGLWLLFGFVFICVFITFYALNKSNNQVAEQEPNAEDSIQVTPNSTESIQEQAADTSADNEVPATNTTTTNEQVEEPIAAHDPLEILAPLEALLAPSQQSSIFEFVEMQASTNSLNDQMNLIIEGELYTAVAADSFQLRIKVYNNDPTLYPASPILQAPITPRLLEEEEVIAFAAKQAYSILYDELVDLESGLYYFQFTQIDDSTPLYTGKFINQ